MSVEAMSGQNIGGNIEGSDGVSRPPRLKWLDTALRIRTIVERTVLSHDLFLILCLPRPQASNHLS